MHPVLFQGFGLTLYSFGLLVALGVASGIYWLLSRCAARGEDATPYMQVTFIALLGAFIGARLLFLIYFPELWQTQGLAAVFASGGLVWYGGVAGALLGATLALWKIKPITFWQWLDRLSPSVALGLAFGRLGCLLAGCCYGAACQLPWAIQYPIDHPTHPLWVHPSPLYESLGAFLLAYFLGRLEKNTKQTGRVAAWFFSLAGLLRFLVEMSRGDTLSLALGLSVSQWGSLLMLAFGLFLFWKSRYASAPAHA